MAGNLASPGSVDFHKSRVDSKDWLIVKPIVLIVEDEALLRLVAASMLHDAGFETLEADTAEDALHVLEKHDDVRVVFSDVQLPGRMDGLHLARAVHDRWPNIGLLLTSGGVKVQKGQIPCDGRFLAKPYDADMMVEAVRNAM
jgi:DNA-binding NtrC family response regulator